MPTVDVALAAAATLVAVAFGCCTLERWLARRRPHELAWTISLGLFAAASTALWLGLATGWSDASFRAFYLFGAILNVPWLALGSVYLLGGRRIGDPAAKVVALVSAFAAGVVAVAPLEAPVPSTGLPRGSELFGPLPRVLAAVCSGIAALVIFGLAVVSAGRLLRRRARSSAAPGPTASTRLAVGNILIAVGTLVLSASGTLNARFGEVRSFLVTLVLGVTILFCGFLVATVTPPRPHVLRSAQDPAEDLATRVAG